MKKSLTLLIPAYNEEKLIEETVKYYYSYLKKLKTISSFEIIVCINGTTDNTEEVVKKICKKNKTVRYLITKKKGIGIGITLGMKAAKKDIVTYMPGDAEIKAEFIEEALKLMDSNTFVVGSRKEAGEYAGKNLLRKITSHGFNFVLMLTLSKKAAEAASVKMFTKKWGKSAAKRFTNYGFEWQIEIIYLALMDKLKIVSAPSQTVSKRDLEESSVNPIRASILLFKACVKYGLRYRFRFFRKK